MTPCDIEEIDVFIHPVPALGGNTNGVISILTKFGNPNYDWSSEKEPGSTVVGFVGYEGPMEFYSARYTYKESNTSTSQPDLRSTLYWNPNVRTNADGKTKIVFYNSDAKSTKTVNLQGITSSGKPFAAFINYPVK
jgi:hypothetical protein